jgi:hypothetical protein
MKHTMYIIWPFSLDTMNGEISKQGDLEKFIKAMDNGGHIVSQSIIGSSIVYIVREIVK